MRQVRLLSLHLFALVCVVAAAALASRGASAAEGPPEHVQLTIDRYEALLARLRAPDGASSFGRGSVRITAPQDGASSLVSVSVSARLVASPASGSGAVIAVLPGDVVLKAARLDGSDLTLVRRDGAYAVVLPDGSRGGGLSLEYDVPMLTASGAYSVVVPLPPMPGSDVTVDGREGARLWPAGVVSGGGSSLSASVPATAAVAVEWAGAGAGTIHRASHRLEVSADVLRATLVSKVDVVTREANTWVRIAPAEYALVDVMEGNDSLVTRVQGDHHEVEIPAKGRHAIEIQIATAVDRSEGQPKVTIPLGEVPISQLAVVVPGKRAIELSPAMPLVTTVSGATDAEVTTASANLPPLESVSVTWAESLAAPEEIVRVSADSYQILRLSEGVLRSQVHVRYQILRGKVKELALQVPDDAVLYKVTGDGIEDWRTFAPEGDAPRQVRVTLGQEQEGAYNLILELEAVVSQKEGSPLPIPLVRPLNAFRETGVVALLDGDKVGFSPVEQTTYTTVGQDALPSDIRQALDRSVTQAFKHIGEPGKMKATVTAVKTREVLYDARTQALYSVKEGAVVASATIQVEVKSGKSERLVLTFPEEVTILGVIAPSLAKKGDLPAGEAGIPKGRKGYELRFAQALEGTIEVHLEFELVPKTQDGGGRPLHPRAAASLKLPDVRVLGAEVEEGAIGITAETGIEVTPATATELRRVDISELPSAVRKRVVGGVDILHGYTYSRAPWGLELNVKRHETVQTLTAVVNAAWLETTLYDDGQVATRAVYEVRNEDKQFIRLGMPEGAKVWTVVIDGQPVKAVTDESGALAIPLGKGRRGLVEIVYQARAPEGLSTMGSLEMLAPKLDVLVTDLQWLVRVPARLAVHGIDTTLTEADAGGYRGPPATESALPVTLPPSGETVSILLTRPVTDPAEEAARLSFRFVTRPPTWTASALGALAVLGPMIVTRPSTTSGPCGPVQAESRPATITDAIDAARRSNTWRNPGAIRRVVRTGA